MPSMPLRVLCPVASAVPAAAESVTGDDAEYVSAIDATGICITSSFAPSPSVALRNPWAADTAPIPMPSPIM